MVFCKILFRRSSKYFKIERLANFGSCINIEIGNKSGVGTKCQITANIKIGNDGAGSVVTKNVSEYEIVGGNPAKIIKMRK